MPLISDDVGPFLSARTEPYRPRAGGLGAVLDEWLHDSALSRNVVLHEQLPAQPALTQPLPAALAPEVRSALAARGLHELYTHQAQAFELAADGCDVVVATPTASGKSLCYNLPVLHALASERAARALYLFPTKALARDQESALRALLSEAGLAAGAITYDGDTPADARRAARDRSAVVLTNPDMLHAGILPHHTAWARLFANLRYVVLDELHTYRGVFGSHLANVLRRLLRIARFHGGEPRFIFASATIGNPAEHAARMLGRPVRLVDQNGAPRGPRRVLVYNPPVVNAELGIRASYIKTAVRLSADLVSAGVSTLVFGQSRNNVEVMLKYLRERLSREKRDPESVYAYRGGYLPEQRRAIERSLRDGTITCVVATNALELGIDIGWLDAVVCAGYPGSIAALWQRFGRSGRRGHESLSLLVTSSAPLDQYLAAAPEALLQSGVEQARIDPDNVEILVQHLKCAAFELPFASAESFGDVPADSVNDALEFLAQHSLLHKVSGVYHWASDAYPANHVSLRSIGWDNFVIVDLDRDQVIGEMDYRAAHTMLHEQAIYQHVAEQYQVERLDFDNHKAFVRKVDSDYFTDAMTHVRVQVLEEQACAELGRLPVACGDVSVIEKVVGYKKIRFHTHENVGYGEVSLPELQMHTSAIWLTVPEASIAAQPVPRAEVVDALRGLGHALHVIASVSLMVDPRDLGQTLALHPRDFDRFSLVPDAQGGVAPPQNSPHYSSSSRLALRARPGAIIDQNPSGGALGDHHQAAAPLLDVRVYLYDRMPGGVGLAPRLYDAREELLRRTRNLLERCPCQQGCPACVGPVVNAETAGSSRRQIALAVLSDLGIGPTH